MLYGLSYQIEHTNALRAAEHRTAGAPRSGRRGKTTTRQPSGRRLWFYAGAARCN